MGDRTAARLFRLLGEERTAILSGDYDTLPAIAARKDTLFARLGPSDPALPDLAAAVQRNQRLLEAAMRGLATGRDAIAARSGPVELTTYAADGRTSATQAPGTDTLDRRA